jgi:hypothetical protein
MGIDTTEVLEAAGTKWNFLPFRPGLVGGHCIGVDPYYLTHKAEMLGYHPAGHPGRPPHQRRHGQVHRRADDQADDLERGCAVKGANVIVLGLTFKEELRRPAQQQGHRRHRELQSYGVKVLSTIRSRSRLRREASRCTKYGVRDRGRSHSQYALGRSGCRAPMSRARSSAAQACSCGAPGGARPRRRGPAMARDCGRARFPPLTSPCETGDGARFVRVRARCKDLDVFHSTGSAASVFNGGSSSRLRLCRDRAGISRALPGEPDPARRPAASGRRRPFRIHRDSGNAGAT